MSEQIDKIVAEIDKIVESYALAYAVDKDALFEAVVKDKLYITFTKKRESFRNRKEKKRKGNKTI